MYCADFFLRFLCLCKILRKYLRRKKNVLTIATGRQCLSVNMFFFRFDCHFINFNASQSSIGDDCNPAVSHGKTFDSRTFWLLDCREFWFWEHKKHGNYSIWENASVETDSKTMICLSNSELCQSHAKMIRNDILKRCKIALALHKNGAHSKIRVYLRLANTGKYHLKRYIVNNVLLVIKHRKSLPQTTKSTASQQCTTMQSNVMHSRLTKSFLFLRCCLTWDTLHTIFLSSGSASYRLFIIFVLIQPWCHCCLLGDLEIWLCYLFH